MASSRGSSCRAIIVHPHFLHTLRVLPEGPPPPPRWVDLPEEIAWVVVSLLNAPDVCRLATVCRDTRRLCADQRIWRRLCSRRFGVPPKCEPPCWKELFEFNYGAFIRICFQQQAAAAASMPPLHLSGLQVVA